MGGPTFTELFFILNKGHQDIYISSHGYQFDLKETGFF